jgi:hypothetical protein
MLGNIILQWQSDLSRRVAPQANGLFMLATARSQTRYLDVFRKFRG